MVIAQGESWFRAGGRMCRDEMRVAGSFTNIGINEGGRIREEENSALSAEHEMRGYQVVATGNQPALLEEKFIPVAGKTFCAI